MSFWKLEADLMDKVMFTVFCFSYIEKVFVGIGLLQGIKDLDDSKSGILLAN